MDKELESRWQQAARQKHLTPDQLGAMVDEMEKGLTIPQNWSQRVEASIRKEKAEVEERYGIRIGQTEIRCKACGKPWGTFHTCQGMSPERRAEVEELKAEFERPFSLKSLSEWQAEFGIHAGMSRQEAVEKFLYWQAGKRTCERCGGEKYTAYCPVRLICKEANDYVRDVERDDNGDGALETDEPQTIRAILSEKRERASLRQALREEAGLS